MSTVTEFSEVRSTQAVALDDLRTLVVALTATAVFLLTAYYDVLNNFTGWTVCASLFSLTCWGRVRNSLGWMLLFSGITLYVVPYLSLQIVAYPVQVAWFALFILFTEVMLRAQGRPVDEVGRLPAARSGIEAPIASLAVLAIGIALSSQGELLGFLLFVAWGCSLIPFERAMAAYGGAVGKLVLIGLYYLLLGVYVLFVWDGFGRTFISAFFLAPLLILLTYRIVQLPVAAFAAAALTLPFIGRVLRFGWSDGLAGIADDSGASHIIVTSEIWASPALVTNAGTLSDQWVLLFGNWLPRALWSGKPSGIGSTFVDTYIGRTGYSEGHSTALGIFGEHIYLGQGLWLVSTVALLVAVLILRASIAKLAAPYLAPVIVFDVCLLTLIWGGMASFGARVWFPLIPMVLIAVVLNRRDRFLGTSQPAARLPDGAC